MLIIRYSIFTILCSNLLIYPFIPLFITSYQRKRHLRKIMNNGEQMGLLKAWSDMNSSNRKKLIYGIMLLWIFILFSFYMTFSFCAVYTDSQSTFLIGWFITIFIDIFVMEILVEIWLVMLYSCRRSVFFKYLILNQLIF